MNIAKAVFDAVGGKRFADMDTSGNNVCIPGPGHGRDDRSLSVRNDASNPDGFVVNSFAGDDAAACRDHVRRLAGLPSWQPTRTERPTDPQFVYRDEQGRPYLRVTKVHKGAGKSFYQHKWNGREWVSGAQQRRIPYHLPAVIGADTVYIVEGEKDADNLMDLGEDIVATSAPEGAGKWRSELNHWFDGKTVIILADNDEPGRKHADQVERELTGVAASVKQVHFPMLPEKGDVSDWLALGNGKAELLEYCKKQSGTISNGNVAKPDPKRPVIGTAAALKKMTFAPIRYIVPGYIAEGCTLLAGRPKLGKSWMVMEMALAVARGGTCLGGIQCEQGDVLMLALEDNQRRLHSRIKKLMPALVQSGWPETFHYATEWPRANDGGLGYINEWLDAHPHARMIIVDVLAQFRPIRSGKDQLYDGDYRAIKDLQEIASKRNVAIIIVHHTRKSQSESGDPFETVSGSLGLSGAADTTLVLDRNSNGCTLYGRGRDIEEIESAVTFDKTTAKWLVQGSVTEVRRSDERGNILDALIEGGEAMSPSVIATVTGMKDGNVRKLLNAMVKAGEVQKSGYGKYIHPNLTVTDTENPTPGNTGNTGNSSISDGEGDGGIDVSVTTVTTVTAPLHDEPVTPEAVTLGNMYQRMKDGEDVGDAYRLPDEEVKNEPNPSPRGHVTDHDETFEPPAFLRGGAA